MMKTRFPGVASALLLALSFAACDDAGYERHGTNFVDVSPYGMHFYADQTVDSCGLESYDSWTAESSAPDWLSLSPASLDVPAGYVSTDWVYVHATPNTTGQYREGLLTVRGYHEASLHVQQEAYLNIARPMGTTTEGTSIPAYRLELKPEAAADSVIFTVYSDDVTLSSSEDWVTPKDSSFTAGQHIVYLDFSPNLGPDVRRATLTLTSAGVTTPIELSQEVKVDEE